MDQIDNPDHGRRVYESDGIRIVSHPYVPSQAVNDASIAPAGGPVFPAVEDVQINATPT